MQLFTIFFPRVSLPGFVLNARLAVSQTYQLLFCLTDSPPTEEEEKERERKEEKNVVHSNLYKKLMAFCLLLCVCVCVLDGEGSSLFACRALVVV